MKFILIDEQRKENAKKFIGGLAANHGWCVEIKPYKKNRSNEQNSLLWVWYKIISDHVGMTSEELHEEMKVRVLGVEEKEVLGQKLIIPKSTSRLKKHEMTNFLEAVEQTAKLLGIQLPQPEQEIYGVRNH